MRKRTFQSHNGAIAAPVSHCASSRKIVLFQSHNGAIAADQPESSSSSTPSFQSHNGAIAADCGKFLPLGHARVSIPQWCDCCSHFDIKERDNNPVSIPQWCDCCRQSGKLDYAPPWFQSHNGAIAAYYLTADVTVPPYKFQSHNGAIAAAAGRGYLQKMQQSFNPTMVRLLPTKWTHG